MAAPESRPISRPLQRWESTGPRPSPRSPRKTPWGVTAVHEIPTDVITAQIDAVLDDIGADAVKTGMLSSSAIIECVSQAVQRHQVQRLVVDPVMVAKSGDSLLREDAIDSLRSLLLPLAAVVTPNIRGGSSHIQDHNFPGRRPRRSPGDRESGCRCVVVKGRASGCPATDLFFDGISFHEFTASRIDTKNTHGTGCTFASAVAAGLALGMAPTDAVALAKEYVTEAIQRSFPIGQGHGPLNHFWRMG